MKILIAIVLMLILSLVAFIGSYHWDSSKNRGKEFGYYGEFNRVSNALASISGVTITQAWQLEVLTAEGEHKVFLHDIAQMSDKRVGISIAYSKFLPVRLEPSSLCIFSAAPFSFVTARITPSS